jgi:ankyrin repeat protein
MTPLHYAVVSDSIRLVKKLLLFGCDKTIRNKRGQTALDLAIEKEYLNVA